MIEHIRIDPPDEAYGRRVKAGWDEIAKPLDSMGKFEALSARIGAMTRTDKPDIRKKAVIVMCADNGIVEENISQSGREVTSSVTAMMGKGRSSVCRMAQSVGADVFPVDIGINGSEPFPGVIDRKVAMGTRNFAREPAMTEEETHRAITIGMEMVRSCKEQGYGILATGEMGIGNTTTSTAVAAALLHCEPEEITGRGAGLNDEGLLRKRQVVTDALARYRLMEQKPFEVLRTVGGLDIAGLAGVCIGGAVYHLPVVLDGVISAAAALTAERMVPGVKEYLIASHISKEPAAALLLRELGLSPVICAELALGEGTGAVLLFPLLDAAFSLYEGGATFAEAKMEQYERFR